MNAQRTALRARQGDLSALEDLINRWGSKRGFRVIVKARDGRLAVIVYGTYPAPSNADMEAVLSVLQRLRPRGYKWLDLYLGFLPAPGRSQSYPSQKVFKNIRLKGPGLLRTLFNRLVGRRR